MAYPGIVFNSQKQYKHNDQIRNYVLTTLERWEGGVCVCVCVCVVCDMKDNEAFTFCGGQ